MKHLIFYLLPFVFSFACSNNTELAQIPEPEIVFDENQVYYSSIYGFPEIIPYNETCNVVGEPSTITGGHIPSSTYTPEHDDLPWIIEGKVNNGIWDNSLFGRIYIYYSEETFSKLNDGMIELKSGWNFIEVLVDFENGGRTIGRISQNINDFLKEDYWWAAEMMIGTGPNS